MGLHQYLNCISELLKSQDKNKKINKMCLNFFKKHLK